MDYKHDIFLSHNRADQAWAELLATEIENDITGPLLKVFFDKWDILPGSDIPAELEDGLQTSHYVGLVLSPESLASDWVAMERSTAIYRDPRARSQHLIPLLRRTCTIPNMLARLNFIDFRKDENFDSGLSDLVSVLRGRPLSRGGIRDIADVHFREDSDLLRQHRKIFDRPAFRVSCTRELSVRELLEAIDDTNAAINTGSLYSRSRNLLGSFSSRSEYRLLEFRSTFDRISFILTNLKRTVVEFQDLFHQLNPSYSDRQDFCAYLSACGLLWLFGSSLHELERDGVRELVGYMDRIDSLRNEILCELNVLLKRCGLDTLRLVQLSSEVLKRMTILE
jgi:hypothetical protein